MSKTSRHECAPAWMFDSLADLSVALDARAEAKSALVDDELFNFDDDEEAVPVGIPEPIDPWLDLSRWQVPVAQPIPRLTRRPRRWLGPVASVAALAVIGLAYAALRPTPMPVGCVRPCQVDPAGHEEEMRSVASIPFARDADEAAARAAKENKLLLILTLSGNFEDARFT